jgi:hypothetical protein
MADKHYVVTGTYVTVRTGSPPAVVGLYSGAPWPPDADPDDTRHHLDTGLIAEVGKPPEVHPPVGAAPTEPVDPETAAVPEDAGAADREPPARNLTQERALRLQTTGTLEPPVPTRAEREADKPGGGQPQAQAEEAQAQQAPQQAPAAAPAAKPGVAAPAKPGK